MAAIRGGHNVARRILAWVGTHWDIEQLTGRDVDGSLQRLRKAGRIQYDAATGWKEVTGGS